MVTKICFEKVLGLGLLFLEECETIEYRIEKVIFKIAFPLWDFRGFFYEILVCYSAILNFLKYLARQVALKTKKELLVRELISQIFFAPFFSFCKIV